MKKRPLTPEEAEPIERNRETTKKLLTDDSGRGDTAAEQLTLLDAMFREKAFLEPSGVIADVMGVILGDALCQVLGLEWVMVEDDGGTVALAVSYPGKMVFCHPIDMIHKRIEREEEVHAFHLFVATAESMSKMLRSGNYKNG